MRAALSFQPRRFGRRRFGRRRSGHVARADVSSRRCLFRPVSPAPAVTRTAQPNPPEYPIAAGRHRPTAPRSPFPLPHNTSPRTRVPRGRSGPKQRSERLCRRPRTPAYAGIPKPIDTQGLFPTLCAVCPQPQQVLSQRRRRIRPHPAHPESTDCPQGCPRRFHRLPTFDPHAPPVTHQGEPEGFRDPQSLGTTRLTAGDNHGDN
jgi:hypothetical protein